MNRNECVCICKYLENMGENSFIAFSNGMFQDAGINAYLLSNAQKGERIQGGVISYSEKNKVERAVFSVNSSLNTIYFWTHDFLEKEGAKISCDKKSQNSGKLYVIYLMEEHIDFKLVKCIQDYFPNKKVNLVVTMEGMASFGSKKTRWLHYSLGKTGIAKTLYTLKGTLVYYKKNFLLWKFSKKNNVEQYTLFEKHGEDLAINQEISRLMRASFENAGKLISVDADHYHNVVLFNTQPITMQNGDKINDDEVLIEIANLVKEKGLRPMVKPHPNEKDYLRYEKYGFEIDTLKDYCQEIIFSQIKEKPIAFVGLYSTTLILGTYMFGIDAISIFELFGKFVKFNDAAKCAYKDAKIRFRNINIVSSMEEFESVLENSISIRNGEDEI